MSRSDDLERQAMDIFGEAMDLAEEDIDAWLKAKCAEDEALLHRVLDLLEADYSSDGMLQTGGAGQETVDGPDPERAGGYKIVDLIGRGGMGAVYAGERDLGDFDHKVAIKVIQPGVLRASLVERFERERQILASLNHPNIARLYDGGHLEDGSPYMVMEFVDGEPILDWADAYDLTLDDRLQLFTEIGEAISHAHQNLVVHRDITPSNVLVTRDGVVKVIDFGIAKPHEIVTPSQAPESEGRRVASMSFTPGYAAPERRTGAPVNTLSDVYSLGKLLSDLTEGFDTPDVEAIARQATAIEPDQRYMSVDAMIEDVQRYREKRPVAARGGGIGYVFSKYLVRNRIAVGLTTLVIASLVIGLVTTTMMYKRAEAERAAADKRFSQVRSLASFMMFDLYDELEKVSGNTRTISMLADEAEHYLTSLASDDRASLEVKLDTIVGLKRLADITGNPKNGHMGKRLEAGVLLEEALVQAEALYAAYPDNIDAIRSLADVSFSAATHTYVTTEKYDRAYELASQSARLWALLAARPDASFDDKRQAVRSAMLTAVPLPWIGRHEESVDILKVVRERGQALVSEFPDEIEATNLLGSINVELARALVRYGNAVQEVQDVIPYWNDAVALRREAYARDPDTIKPYRSLVTIYYERGASYREIGEYDKAYEDTLASEQIAEELLEKDPDDAWVRRILGGIREEKIKTLSYAGRHEEALALAGQALAQARAEFAGSEADYGIRREWGYSLVLMSDVYARAGETDDACRLAAEARDIWDSIGDETELSELDISGSIATLETVEALCD